MQSAQELHGEMVAEQRMVLQNQQFVMALTACLHVVENTEELHDAIVADVDGLQKQP